MVGDEPLVERLNKKNMDKGKRKQGTDIMELYYYI